MLTRAGALSSHAEQMAAVGWPTVPDESHACKPRSGDAAAEGTLSLACCRGAVRAEPKERRRPKKGSKTSSTPARTKREGCAGCLVGTTVVLLVYNRLSDSNDSKGLTGMGDRRAKSSAFHIHTPHSTMCVCVPRAYARPCMMYVCTARAHAHLVAP